MEEYANNVKAYIANVRNILEEYVDPKGKTWLIYRPRNIKAVAYTAAERYKIPDGFTAFMELGNIKKLNAAELSVGWVFSAPNLSNVLVVNFCGSDNFDSTSCNIPDWIMFMSDSMACYRVNCNPESEYYGKIIAVYSYKDYVGDHYINIGDINTLIGYINKWLNYTTEECVSLGDALKMECKIDHVVKAVRGTGYTGIVTYGIALEKANCTSNAAKNDYMLALEYFTLNYESMLDVELGKTVKVTSEQERDKLIAKNIEYLLTIPILSPNDIKSVVKELYRQCVYKDIYTARFSEWLLHKKLK